MKDLASFSIETDDTVLLTYADGTTRRALKDDLPKLLDRRDLKRVKAAFRMRNNYHRALPFWLRTVAIGVVVIGVGIGGMKAVSVVVYPATHTVRHLAINSTQPTGQVLSAGTNSSVPTPAPTSSTSAQSLPSATQLSANNLTAIPTATPTPIALPLGLSVPNPAPLVPGLIHHVTAPVTHALNQLGL
jgi:hypothetical protein